MSICGKNEPPETVRCRGCNRLFTAQSLRDHTPFCTHDYDVGKHSKKSNNHRVLYKRPETLPESVPESEPGEIQEQSEKIIRWENGGFILETPSEDEVI